MSQLQRLRAQVALAEYVLRAPLGTTFNKAELNKVLVKLYGHVGNPEHLQYDRWIFAIMKELLDHGAVKRTSEGKYAKWIRIEIP